MSNERRPRRGKNRRRRARVRSSRKVGRRELIETRFENEAQREQAGKAGVMDLDKLAESFDVRTDTSPIHIVDDHGSFCGLELRHITKSLHYSEDIPEDEITPKAVCAACLGGWQYMKECD